MNYYKNNNIYNTKDNIFNINTFNNSRNNNIHNTNNTIFNSKNIHNTNNENNGAGPILMANAWGLEASMRGESGRVGPFYQITLLAGIHSKRVQELV